MHRTVNMLAPLIIAIFALSHVSSAAESDILKVSKGNAAFARDLYEVLAKEPGNVFFSPISVHAVLSLLQQGSAGETAKKITEVLHLDDSLKSNADGYKAVMDKLNHVDNVTLYLANKVYVKSGYELKSSFKAVASDSFYSDVEAVDFGQSAKAANAINSWVEEKTHDKIKDLISPGDLNALTRLVLLNAIYFKGDWADKFDPKLTKKGPFFSTGGETVDADMMNIYGEYLHARNEALDADIVSLPYKNEALSLLLVVPAKKDGIAKVEEGLKQIDLVALADGLQTTEVNLTMPKFKIESKIELNDVLKKLGLDIIFSTDADLSGLLQSNENLYVSKAVQKAFIEVNEEGAEAAAATAVIAVTYSAIIYPRARVIADRPFLISLVYKGDDSSHVLFLGRVSNPKSA